MKQYLLIILISLSACIERVKISSLKLTKTGLSSNESENDENTKFTLCLEFIQTEEFKEEFKDYFDSLPDDLNELEVGLDICNKLFETGDFKKILDNIKKINPPLKTSLFKAQTANQLYTSTVVNKKTIIDKELMIDEPLLRFCFRCLVKGLLKTVVGIFIVNVDLISKGIDEIVDAF